MLRSIAPYTLVAGIFLIGIGFLILDRMPRHDSSTGQMLLVLGALAVSFVSGMEVGQRERERLLRRVAELEAPPLGWNGGEPAVYRLDDGAYHWVIARSPEEALCVYRVRREQELTTGLDRPSAVLELSRAQAEKVAFDDECDTALAELERNAASRYIGCSEW